VDFPVRRRWLGDLSGESLATAMSLDSATGNATRMVGPLLGGVILQVFSMTGVFVLSTIIFAACLVLVILSETPARAAVASGSHFVRELASGVRFVMDNPRLRRILAVTVAFNIWGFPFTSMIPVIGSDTLSLQPLMVGVLGSAEGFGALIGAVGLTALARPASFFSVYVFGTATYLFMVGYIGALTFVAGGPLHSFLAILAALTVTGVAGACFAAMQGTLTYLGTPPEYRSRVLGVLTLCIGTGPIGFFNIGWMAEAFGVPTALAISSLEGLFALALLWTYGRQDVGEPAPGAPRDPERA
jgi:predicted MFS family arabinose efflux permease